MVEETGDRTPLLLGPSVEKWRQYRWVRYGDYN